MSNFCLYCKKEVPDSTRKKRKYCSSSCGERYRRRINHNVKFTKIDEIDWKHVQKLLNIGCPLSRIQEELYPTWKTARRLSERAREEGIVLERPQFYIQRPVKEIMRFHELVNDIEKGRLSVADVAYDLRWKRSVVRKILELLAVSIPEQVERRQAIRIEPYNKDYIKLTRIDKLVAEKLLRGGKLFILRGAGCDFLHERNGENILVEVKSSVSKYNVFTAILQLLYAKDVLKSTHGVETNKMWLCSKRTNMEKYDSLAKRYLNHFHIELKIF